MSDTSNDPGAEPPPEYEVGYGKPPQHARFQRGRSGNRKGRPPRSRNILTLLARALNERVTVSDKGRRRTITKREAIVAQLVNKSASADLKAMAMLLGLLQQAEGQAAAPRSDPSAEPDERILQSIRDRFAANGGGSDGSEPG
jgi:hypothetical protein